MAENVSHLQGRHVVLPWAPHTGHETEDATAAARVRKDQYELRVGGARLAVDTDVDPQGRRPHVEAKQLDPRLQAMGLPAEPGPTIPEEDRADWEDERVVSLAVALDVLATMTRTMGPKNTILQQLVQALLHTGELGGLGTDTVAGLLAHAASDAGRNRGRLGQRLAACTTLAAGQPTAWPTAVSSPSSVAGAVRNLETTARLVVREAVLLLQAHEPVEYRQV